MAVSNKTIIIQGSSRSNGDTRQVVDYVRQQIGCDFVDLRTKDISHYDYEYNNRYDDFLPLVQGIVNRYDTLIFATPVYWYSMSGIMKDFFDRISDLLEIDKPTGRKLWGKNMAMLSCSGANDRIEGFSIPFIESAKYLGMNYLGDVHAWVEEGKLAATAKENLDRFIEQLAATGEL